MLAKVISFGETRDVALDRIVAALDDTDVRGVVTNCRSCRRCCRIRRCAPIASTPVSSNAI